MHEKLTVAKFLVSFLPFSETFIYSFIKNTKKFNQIIIASKRENENEFPYETSRLFIFDKADTNLINAAIPFRERMFLTRKNRYYYNVLKREKVRLVHAHFGYTGVDALAVTKRLALPLVTSFHGLDMSKLGRDPYYWIKYKELFSFGKAFMVEGSFMRKKLIELGCPEDKAKIIHIGVDLARFKFAPRRVEKDEKIRFVSCSRFVEKKGIPYGIRAFAKALRAYDNMELNIIGGKSKKYQKLIDRLGAGDKIRILDRITHAELARFMRQSHVLLAPSLTARDGDSEGGIPTIVLEALASGMPVISSFHADIPEAVINKKMGLLSPEKDVESLAQNIIQMVARPHLITSMGIEGRKHIEKEYDSVKETAKLERLYAQIINA